MKTDIKDIKVIKVQPKDSEQYIADRVILWQKLGYEIKTVTDKLIFMEKK